MPRGLGWLTARAADPRFHALAARLPLIRRLVRREGAAIFDLISGFVQTQVVLALVRLDVLTSLRDGPATAADLARGGVPADRMEALLRAGIAVGLLRARAGRYTLTQRGAALTAVPGLAEMIDHNAMLYRDMADPVALLRGDARTELAQFWPYTFGADADPNVAARYSKLMADSQALVAQDTLAQVSFAGAQHVLDIGGGTGAFVAHLLAAHDGVRATVFDLPSVAAAPLDRVTFHPGSFRDDPLPDGADTITLIRVLYDHQDVTVTALLAKVFDALPPGGRVVISEPMSGGAKPDRAGDVYFAFYTMAMGTGQVRSQARIGDLLAVAGFSDIRAPRPYRGFITSVVTATKPA